MMRAGALLLFLVAAPLGSSKLESPPDIAALADTLPLKPTRTISFATSEGSWMSVDVSPDGNTIVFDLLGDLYTLPITGGNATRITNGMAWDAHPRFSPDGQRIVFTSDRDGSDNVWTVARDGRDPRQVTNDDERFLHSSGLHPLYPDWLPDGRRIVVAARMKEPCGHAAPYLGTRDALVADVETRAVTPLSIKGLTVSSASAAPDGRSIYVTSSARNSFWQIHRIDL